MIGRDLNKMLTHFLNLHIEWYNVTASNKASFAILSRHAM